MKMMYVFKNEDTGNWNFSLIKNIKPETYIASMDSDNDNEWLDDIFEELKDFSKEKNNGL